MGGASEDELVDCPACGGAGGGPFGPMGSAWDDEEYVCPRCKGLGVVRVAELDAKPASLPRPGIVKTAPEPAVPARKKKPA